MGSSSGLTRCCSAALAACAGAGLVALSPYRGADRDDLTYHGLGWVRAAGNDGLDVVDLDTTGHNHSVPIVCGQTAECCVAECLASGETSSRGAPNNYPIPTLVSGHTHEGKRSVFVERVLVANFRGRIFALSARWAL